MTNELPVIYLARHGETAWSLTAQHTGLTNLPLTERGEQNAKALGKRLLGLKFGKVFTSPLQRAARTCELAGFGAVAEVDRDLLEWNYGQYEGRRTAEIHAERPDWQLFRDGCPGDEGRVQRVSLIEEGPAKHVRMANLAIVGSHSTNGVAAIHSELLRTSTVKDLAEIFPERFNNKTNGVTPRRWLLMSNPALAHVITEAIGDGWVTDLSQLSKLKPLADDKALRDSFRKAKREAKSQFASWLKSSFGQTVDADSIFDCQIKRIHEYKRQLLNALRIVVLYNRLRENPKLEMAPRTFFFSGKAAPAYHLAKLIIKFMENLAGTIDGDPAIGGRLKVLFLPEYDVSLAERLIPASDVSNQISTAGYEASGTSNMKFMMNGALTIGTRDGATIEMAQEAGEENFFLFGLTAEQVAGSRGWYNPHWHYEQEPEIRTALNLIFSDHFSRYEPGVFAPLRDTLLTHGDHYMHLADLTSYLEADQRLRETYGDSEAWERKAILNVAGSGKFSSDRTIAEYATQIWEVKPCPVV